jgi:predicted TIM-barrel fold metal-dependent hydrolase
MAVTLESLRGRIGDLDSHEAIPTPRYPEVFGEIGRRFLDENEELWAAATKISQFSPEDDITTDREDDAEINQENVWTLKGARAPGALNMDRRTDVLNEMGIDRQLIFPMMGIFAWITANGGGQNWMPKSTKAQMQLGKLAVGAYNQWAGARTKKSDRMRMVGMLLSGEPDMTPATMVKQAEEMIDAGVKAITISSGKAPAGLSPGDEKLGPFYATLAKANVALVFHPPSGLGFRSTNVWESSLVHPRHASVINLHIAEENFLASMVLSGVFERHPELRVGFVETGADWIGPLAERMDRSATQWIGQRKLSMSPTEYLRRNVRVSVMHDEPIDVWIQRYPALLDVYCYSSDFPHVEGGEWSLKRLYEQLAPLGDTVLEKFFVTNSQLVLPVS